MNDDFWQFLQVHHRRSRWQLVVCMSICVVVWQLSTSIQVTTEYLTRYTKILPTELVIDVAVSKESNASQVLPSHTTGAPNTNKRKSTTAPSISILLSLNDTETIPNYTIQKGRALPTNLTNSSDKTKAISTAETLFKSQNGQNISSLTSTTQPHASYSSNGSSVSLLHETSTAMPVWMKAYFAWHRQSTEHLEQLARQHDYQSSSIIAHIQRRNAEYFMMTTASQNNSNSSQYSILPHPIQFLILRCNVKDRCGGFADRIKPLPVFLAAAAKSHRILLIRWQRPAPLQEFLVPTELNWTSPKWLEDAIFHRRSLRNNLTLDTFSSGTKMMRLLDPDHQQTFVLEGKIQDANGGEGLYNELVLREAAKNDTELSHGINRPNQQPYFDFRSDSVARYNPIYHDVFHSVFQPSPPVATIIHQTLQAMNLTPGNYISAHFRAGLEVKRGPKFKKDPTYLAEAGVRAVNCSSLLQPGWPIYFATDSRVSLQAVRDYARRRHHQRSIVTFEQPLDVDGTPPPNLHIEKAEDWQTRPPSDFYPTFVDFLVMGSGRCMAYGGGGFGKFAGMLSYNSSCIIDHSRKNTVCGWVD
ncbi:hypothetical protein IV203_030572 [Nitzschia inconspicua]|uniref:O-fucosyltransferase family protein n=1 Tax=Nitzschia inconspicua TaxID=303405 RepID=A0A9K3Q4B2_9STRA|nr:hypothetical protein IV203_022912 [Nitzschia inconspicua]KAG7367829.1 hypothetical protein IV203_030572 [Nitzschia inconspicua]